MWPWESNGIQQSGNLVHFTRERSNAQWPNSSTIHAVTVLLEYVGICWNVLEYVGMCWNMLEHLGIGSGWMTVGSYCRTSNLGALGAVSEISKNTRTTFHFGASHAGQWPLLPLHPFKGRSAFEVRTERNLHGQNQNLNMFDLIN